MVTSLLLLALTQPPELVTQPPPMATTTERELAGVFRLQTTNFLSWQRVATMLGWQPALLPTWRTQLRPLNPALSRLSFEVETAVASESYAIQHLRANIDVRGDGLRLTFDVPFQLAGSQGSNIRPRAMRPFLGLSGRF